MSNSVSKSILDALQTRLAAITASAATPGGKTFNYTPDVVSVTMFTEQCVDGQYNTIWIVEPDGADHEEETTGTFMARQRVSVIGLRRLSTPEHPFAVDAGVPDRATEQTRLEADFMNKFGGNVDGVTLGGLCENVFDGMSPVECGPDTFIENWAAIFIRLRIRFSYTKGAL